MEEEILLEVEEKCEKAVLSLDERFKKINNERKRNFSKRNT